MSRLLTFLLCFISTNFLWSNIFITIHTHSDSCRYDANQIDSISLIEPTPTFVEDINGKPYKVGLLGTNYWMLEDLTSTIYDTLSIHRGVELKIASDSIIMAYQVGPFYNWNAAMGLLGDKDVITHSVRVQGICPNKYHVPNRVEWEDLFASINYSGSTPLRNHHWLESSNGLKRTGESLDDGFNSSPTGYAKGKEIRDTDILSSYWSAESLSYNSALSCRLDATGSLSFSSSNKSLGKSVRCIWDGQTNRDWLYVYLKDSVARYRIVDIKQIVIEDDVSFGQIIDLQNHVYPVKRYGSTLWMMTDLKYANYMYPASVDTTFYKQSAFVIGNNCGVPSNNIYYSMLAVMGNDIISPYVNTSYIHIIDTIHGICPSSWRLPMKEDFKRLVSIDTAHTFTHDFSSAVYHQNSIFSNGSESLYWVSDFVSGYNVINGNRVYYIKDIPYFDNYSGIASRFSFVEISNVIPALPCRCVKDLKEPYLKCRYQYSSKTDSLRLWERIEYPIIRIEQDSSLGNTLSIGNMKGSAYYDCISFIK